MNNFFKIIHGKLIILTLILTYTMSAFAEPTKWRQLTPGLEYAALHPTSSLFNGTLHAFRIDLKRYQIGLFPAKSLGQGSASIEDMVTANHATLGINGGFFTYEAKPLGLRITNGVMTNPLKPISWWGIFYIANNKAYITNYTNFKIRPSVTFAIQTGPRLIINNSIPPLKPSLDSRSALGITQDGKVVVVATESLLLSTQQLAEIMQQPTEEGGLDCQDALNLDGGTSTQLYAKVNNFIIDVPGYKSVVDAVVISPRD